MNDRDDRENRMTEETRADAYADEFYRRDEGMWLSFRTAYLDGYRAGAAWGAAAQIRRDVEICRKQAEKRAMGDSKYFAECMRLADAIESQQMPEAK